LATIGGDQPQHNGNAAQRARAALLERLRLPNLSYVQCRSREGYESYIASVAVAIDWRGRIRAVISPSKQVLDAMRDALPNARHCRVIAERVDPGRRKRRRLGRRRLSQRFDRPLIDSSVIEARGFTRVPEPALLDGIGHDPDGRPMYLATPAAKGWRAMHAAAARDGVTLQPVSTFRSAAYQRGLIARKLKRGDTLATILSVNAAPGYSEHHSGRAIDIGTPGCAALDEAFERTPAFAWLQQHAPTFGFRLSYPRDNALGVIYEPWHWYFVGTAQLAM
jgi:hypothetical protein